MKDLGSHLDKQTAELIINAVHAAWSSCEVDRLLGYYCDDLVYTCNVESDVYPVRIVGREGFRNFLARVLSVTESATVVEAFQFDGTLARATVACFVKHNTTGMVLSGYYRQVFRFRGRFISHLDEFHDAARLQAFWRMVELCEKEEISAGRRT